MTHAYGLDHRIGRRFGRQWSDGCVPGYCVKP